MDNKVDCTQPEINSQQLTLLIDKAPHKRAAHLWLGNDTACRMYSTGGMKSKYGYAVVTVSNFTGKLCHMCQHTRRNKHGC